MNEHNEAIIEAPANQSTEAKEAEIVTFNSLIENKKLLESIAALGFTSATKVQELTIPPALRGKDLVVQAKTGSGKTLAFGLPLLSLLHSAQRGGYVDFTFGLVVTPTRELALQIASVFTGLLPGVTPTLLIGGVPYPKQLRDLQENPQLVIGTPGRILDMMEQKVLDIKRCEFFVLDEAEDRKSVV